LCSWVLVDHPLAKGWVLLPDVAAVLECESGMQWSGQVSRKAYNELLVSQSHREATIEGYSEVLGVVSLVSYDMLEQGSLMQKDFRQAVTEGSQCLLPNRRITDALVECHLHVLER
jgi:hypothetical protein